MNRSRKTVAAVAIIAMLGWVGYREWIASDDDPAVASRTVPANPPPTPRMPTPPANLDVLDKLPKRDLSLMRVTGVVKDTRGSDTGIPNAEVAFANPLGEATTVTDDDGRYEIQLRPGLYRAFARAEGYVSIGTAPPERVPGPPDLSTLGAPTASLAPIVVVDRDQDGVDIHVHGAAEVYGTVYDTSGRPVDGALVVAELAATGRWGMVRPVLGTHVDETDYDGSYHLVVPTGYTRLAVTHAQYAGVDPYSNYGRTLSAGERTRIDLTLVAGCIISGTVVDAEGYRVGEGALELNIGAPPPNDFAPVGRIDANGDFRYASQSPGKIELRAWPWKSPAARPIAFDCSDGARHEDVLFVVPAAEPSLQGELVTAAGQPLPFAFVDIHPLDPGGMAQQERTDKFGEWAVYSLPEGDYQVTAYVEGEGAAATMVRVPQRGISLQLSGTGSIAGRVTGLDGEGDGSFTMTIVRCNFDLGEGFTSRFDQVSMPDTEVLVPVIDGQYRVNGVPACPVDGAARFNGYTREFSATVIPSGAVTVDLDLGSPTAVTDPGVDW